MNLYLTADQIGTPTGGGVVTYHESEALKSLGPCEIWSRDDLSRKVLPHFTVRREEPWLWDVAASVCRDNYVSPPRLAHIYSGTFSETVGLLKSNNVKVTYTAAAHDVGKSRKEHEKLGLTFDYPHLNDPKLWQRYLAGYLAADVVVCPSEYSASCMRAYGAKNIKVIPHGVSLPDLSNPTPLPTTFTVGYLGACGAPDKGVRYLLEAWKKLNYKDAVLLLGGRDSTSPWVRHLVQTYGGGNIQLLGWVKDVSTFYNVLSLYVQPSCTEGFGIEVLEALAHSRPVVCSDGAGAVDVIREFSKQDTPGWEFSAGNVGEMIDVIRATRAFLSDPYVAKVLMETTRTVAIKYTWDKIRQQYIDLWRGLLNE